MPVNHHGGVSNGKIGELHRTDTGAANLENRHINVRPELDIVNGQPVFAGARAGAFCKAGGYLLYRCTVGGEGVGICALFHKPAGRMGAVYDLEIGASRTQ